MPKGTRDKGSTAGGQRWSRDAAARFREYAAQIRELADRERDAVIRARLLALADQYETLAARAEADPASEP